MKSVTISVILLLLFEASATADQNPGIQMLLTSKGINFAKDVVLGFVRDVASNLAIPNINESNYVVSDFRTTSFDLGTTKVNTESPIVFKVGVKGATATATGKWKASDKILFFTINGMGKFHVSANIDLEQTIGFGRNSDKPAFWIGSCSADVTNIDIQLEGNYFLQTWIYNILLGFFKDRISRELKDKICENIKGSFAEQTKKFSNEFQTDFPLVFGTNQPIKLNVGLISNPVVTTNSITIALRGRCFPMSMPWLRFPFIPPTAPVLSSYTSKMARISISPYVMNTLLYSMWKNNVLKKSFTQQQLSSVLGSPLTANTLAPFLTLAPYGYQQLQAEVLAIRAPKAQFTTRGVTISGKFDIIAGPPIAPNAATINTDVEFMFTPLRSGGIISGSMSNMRVVITNVGALSSQARSKMNKLIEDFLLIQMLPALNSATETGFEYLRIYGFAFSDTSIYYRQNAITMETNFRKLPTTTAAPPSRTIVIEDYTQPDFNVWAISSKTNNLNILHQG
ncbi:unnamed protein product [Clavelina lepadiformis]|uniref:Lipid-binding serum glycoprotein C-terminal domain-containing protein n=1 Tax=Clavelina lepadiformis TaxID=159417 RepID=A0ABP0FGP8_CLALP